MGFAAVDLRQEIRLRQQTRFAATRGSGDGDDAGGRRGPYEEALLGTPVADPEQPLEILRTVHSFDPCMACGVHVVDGRRRELARVRAA
jgi:Ni,Fe-hydrogenase I large subunit